MTRLLFLSGSSQAGSVNWRLARAAAELAQRAFRAAVSTIVVDLADFDLPAYSVERRATPEARAVVARLKAELAACDGIFMGSDEYTGMYSTRLRTAVDWLGSDLPDGAGLFDGVVIAVCGASLRGVGGLRGQPALHQMLAEQGAIVISQQIEIGTASSPFDAEGRFLPRVERQLLGGALARLVAEAARKPAHPAAAAVPDGLAHGDIL